MEGYTETDPKVRIASRNTLVEMIQGLDVPPNYRVVLDVDRLTENLVLSVLRRDPRMYKLWGRVIWTTAPTWVSPECEQRKMIARTYESMLMQLNDRPEFLEFEVAVEGKLVHRMAVEC